MTKEAFMEQVLAMQSTLYYVSYGLLSNREDSDDAVQECIRRAIQKRETLRDDRYFKTWVTRILINECHNISRHRKRESPTDNIFVTVPEGVDYGLFEIVSHLDEKLRLPVILHYMEGYTMKDVAKILSTPESTIKSRLARAKILIGQTLESQGVYI